MLTRLNLAAQQQLVAAAREVVRSAPLYRATTRSGGSFNYLQTGAGWGWTSDARGYRYQREHPVTGHPLPPIPEVLVSLARAHGLEADALLVNWYTQGSSLGLHQDRDERDLSAPIVSVSLGDTAEFLLGGLRRSDPVEVLELTSGTVLVLAGADRMRFHGVRRVRSGTAPAGLLAGAGRVNLTLRKSQ